MGWLYAHGAMRTKDKLIMFGLDVEDSCFMCAQTAESIDHLMCDCVYSRRIIQEINQRLQLMFPITDLLGWCNQKTGTKLQKGLQFALLWGIVYSIWQQRNKRRMEGMLQRPERVAKYVIEEVKARLNGRDFRMLTKTDIDWLKNTQLCV
ncbi:uncharacterized protein LOC141608566 [Silene latifolia]|uniref:uncharacterized protein LOC141608566 n=1 Tax=Silene latifolia TaxID=37657 RepID=UPI003D771F90